MRVRILKYCASPDGGYAADTMHDIDDALARAYIEKGRAEEVRRGRPPNRTIRPAETTDQR